MSKKTKKKEDFVQQKYDRYLGSLAAIKMAGNAKEYASFNVFHSLKMKWMQNVLSAVLVLICAIIALYRKQEVAAIVFFVLTPIFPFFLVLIQYLSVKARLSSDRELLLETREYVFFDDCIVISSKEGKRETKVNVGYGEIYKAFERKAAYYVYLDDKTAFVLSKNAIVSGDEGKINAVFSEKLGGKFKARRK